MELSCINPRFSAGNSFWNILAWLLETKIQPYACTKMVEEDDDQNQTGEYSQVILSLLGIFLKGEFQNKFEWMCDSAEMDNPDEFKTKELDTLIHYKSWNS
jgi:hypothetical protein